jgi:hypothetical protein
VDALDEECEIVEFDALNQDCDVKYWFRHVTTHAMLNFSSPDQKFRNTHVHNHNQFSDPTQTCDNTSNVNFFQPGSEIQKNPDWFETCDVMCDIDFFQPGLEIQEHIYTCMCTITIKNSQDQIRQSTTHRMLNFSSPD